MTLVDTQHTPAGPAHGATAPDPAAAVEQFAGQVLGTIIGAATTAMMVIGDELGLYRALASGSPMTAGELATASGCAEQYVQEWLWQQTAVGLVDLDGDRSLFSLPPVKAAVLADEASPAFLAGGALMTAGWFRRTERIAEAFRTGGGVAWHEQDHAVHVGTDRFFAPGNAAHLVDVWLPELPEVTERLASGGRVADVGCGRGASSVLLAQAFPRTEVFGFDSHRESIEAAARRARTAGVEDSTRFEVADAAAYPGTYDLVCLFDTLHDLGDPVAAARHARSALAPGGVLLVVEPSAAASGSENVARPASGLAYAASTFQCIPASLAQPGALGLGAQAGPEVTMELLRTAGFDDVRLVAETPVNAVYVARA